MKNLLKVIMISGWIILFLPSCKEDHSTGGDDAVADSRTYTCPMHPQIIQKKMGTCPICAMDLVLFDRSEANDFLTLSSTQQALANISVIQAGAGAFSSGKEIKGRIITNPESTEYVSARVGGRIERLWVKETGVEVRSGQVLYEIYSEELAALQQELIIASEQSKAFPENERFAEILQAAEKKLALYGQSRAQINRIKTEKKTSPLVQYASTADGLVAELMVAEGQYVAEGGSIMRVEKYSDLWVEGDLHPADMEHIAKGRVLDVIIVGFENKPVKMKIDFISPALQSASHLLTIRGTIKNAGGLFQPGMQARVFLPVSTGSETISVPANAVIHEAAGSHVWIETEDGTFEPRIVRAGVQDAGKVEILDGIDEGENVVVSGAYLLYSEYLLKKGKHVH